ncbi:MAG TPA: hypothetical protein VHM27_00035 [Rhizomicrobium sp.]|jgi:hypothetical protein|nr:hypothetical protein [Rhizomicrobium sp.]
MKPHLLILLLFPLSACDDSGGFSSNDRSGAPRGTFSHAGSDKGNGAPERGELERLRLDNRSQRPAPPPVPIGGAPASPTGAGTTERDPQTDLLTGRPTTP